MPEDRDKAVQRVGVGNFALLTARHLKDMAGKGNGRCSCFAMQMFLDLTNIEPSQKDVAEISLTI
jgi:hypothetical protein